MANYKQLGTHEFIEQQLSNIQIDLENISSDLTAVEYSVENITSDITSIYSDINTINDTLTGFAYDLNDLTSNTIPFITSDIDGINTITIPAITNDISSVSAKIDSALDPYQEFTSEITSATSVYVITRSHGLYPKAVITSNASISIDTSTYPTNGTSSVKVSLSVNTNQITFGQIDVEYIEPFDILSNSWNTIYFEKTANSKWKAMTW